jgi:hypothetical protein
VWLSYKQYMIVLLQSSNEQSATAAYPSPPPHWVHQACIIIRHQQPKLQHHQLCSQDAVETAHDRCTAAAVAAAAAAAAAATASTHQREAHLTILGIQVGHLEDAAPHVHQQRPAGVQHVGGGQHRVVVLGWCAEEAGEHHGGGRCHPAARTANSGDPPRCRAV